MANEPGSIGSVLAACKDGREWMRACRLEGGLPGTRDILCARETFSGPEIVAVVSAYVCYDINPEG